MTAPAPTPRSERVPFTRPVLVKPLDGSTELRVQGANLSRSGMFLKSAETLEPGTRVEVALEAKGQQFPFAQAEVIWERPKDAAQDSVLPGFGLKFIHFLHPRGPELVEALVGRAVAKGAKDLTPPKKQPAPAPAPAAREPAPTRELLEQFAAPPAQFTELSLAEESKLELELPPPPRRTRTDPEFVRAGEPLVIELEKPAPAIPEVELDEDFDSPPPSALRPGWPKLMGALAFAPLFLVPLGVAIGTWRASKSPEPTVAVAEASQAREEAETRTVELAPPAPPAVEAPRVDPAWVEPLVNEAGAGSAQKIEEVAAAKKVDEVAAAEPRSLAKSEALARVDPAPKKLPSSALPLDLAAVKSLALTSEPGRVTVDVALGDGSSVHRAFALKAPDRLVIDVRGPTPPRSAVHAVQSASGIERVRVGALPDGVRLVIDVTGSVSAVQADGDRISAKLGE